MEFFKEHILNEREDLDRRVKVLRQKIAKLDDFGYKNGYDTTITFDMVKDTVENHLTKYKDELAKIYDSKEFFEEDKLDLDEALGLKESSYDDKEFEVKKLIPQKNMLTKALERFDRNGTIAHQGPWEIYKGRYDLAFQIRYNDLAIIDGVDDGYGPTEIHLDQHIYNGYDARTLAEYVSEFYGNCEIIDESLKEDTHLINSYYIVDSDGEIKGDNLTRQEAKELTKQLKDIAKDYIYVTRNISYEKDGHSEKSYEDIVDVDIDDANITVHKDLFNVFKINEKLIQSDSEKAFKKNIETEIKAGKDPKQAIAIAHSVKEKNEDLIEKVLKESVVTVYNGTNDNNLDYKNIDFTKSKELGIHCGSEKAASSRGSIINKLSIDTSDCYKMDVDFTDIWSTPTLLKYIDFLTAEEIADAKNKIQEVSGDYDKYEKYSTILRDLFLKHGYKCISYPNEIEDPGHTSYIILDDSIIIDESIKEDLEYDYDDAKSWEGIFDIADEQKTANSFQQPVIGKDKTYLPKLSVEEVRELALEHYNEGGDVVVECWTDEDIMLWLEEHPTKEELLDLFSKYYDHYQDMRGYGDYAILDKEDSEDSTDDEQELYQDYYDEENFGPSNPWDAPGMSIKDFIR